MLNKSVFPLFIFIVSVTCGYVPFTKVRVPERHHKIFLETANKSGTFDIYYEIDSGIKIGCRGAVQIGQEEVSELYVEDEGGLHRMRNPGARQQRSKLRLLVLPDIRHKSDLGPVEQIGLDHFNLWPRECVQGLLRYRIDDLVGEEAHRDATSGLMNIKTYKVAPNSDKETKLFWWNWSRLKDLIFGPGDEDHGRVPPTGQCEFCGTWGSVLQGGVNNDQGCTFFNISISEGVVLVEPRPSENSQLNSDQFPEERDAVLNDLKSVTNTTTPGHSNQGHSSPTGGGGSSGITITITVGGGGGVGGTSALSPGGSGGDAMGFTIASANSNFNSGFYGCNSDHIEFHGPSILGVQDPCDKRYHKPTHTFPKQCG